MREECVLKSSIIIIINVGAVHLKNLVTSPRARVQWLLRSQVKEAKHFVESVGLNARCGSPADLDFVLDDSRL